MSPDEPNFADSLANLGHAVESLAWLAFVVIALSLALVALGHIRSHR